jgi:cytochrome oxidase Cu insertion factor (SCO1/SenC/PrrC family)
MFANKKPILFVLIFAVLLAACAPAAAGTDVMTEKQPTEAMMEKEDDSMMADATATSDAMMEKDKMAAETATAEAMMEKDDSMADGEKSEMSEDKGMMETPAFFSAALTNVATGESFTINDLKGKVILVETLAQWCPTCRKQQQQVVDLHQLLGEREDFVSLGLNIDPNEDAAMLKSYIESNGFSWTYAVAPPEVSNEIATLYGDQFINPPSAPMFIIDRQGEVHLLPFGVKNAQDLLAALQPFLNEGM